MSQDNIFREIDEELRTDRIRSLWKRFAPFVIGGAVAIVALVAVNEGWSWYTKSQSAAASEELYSAYKAAESGDLDAAQSQLEAIAAKGGGYGALAQFRAAGLLAEKGDTANAVAAYDGLANSQSNTRLRELALLLAAQLLVDNGSLVDVQARIATLATDDNPMRRTAHELLGLAQYKAGEATAAQASFEAVLNDPLAAQSTRSRISFYLAQMLSEGVITPVAPAADEAAAATDAPVAEEAPAAE